MKKFIIFALILLASCSLFSKKQAKDTKKTETTEIKKTEGDDMKYVYQMTPEEVDKFIKKMRKDYPVLRDRIAAIARKNLSQPYSLHLLGEFPFEIYDPQPLLSIDHGDCVVFSEHVYAMALSYDWQSFFTMLQRIRYKNGEISAVTRNHYTLADWDVNNSWLVSDFMNEIDPAKTETVVEKINRTKFFKDRFKINMEVPNQNYETKYIPAEFVKDVLPLLKNGDFVNIIRGKDINSEYCGHVGLITISKDGIVNFLHSTPPKSIEQPILEYVNDNIKKNEERKKKGEVLFLGIKFLRLNNDPISELIKIDGDDAPVVTAPKGLIKKMPKN